MPYQSHESSAHIALSSKLTQVDLEIFIEENIKMIEHDGLKGRSAGEITGT